MIDLNELIKWWETNYTINFFQRTKPTNDMIQATLSYLKGMRDGKQTELPLRQSVSNLG